MWIGSGEKKDRDLLRLAAAVAAAAVAVAVVVGLEDVDDFLVHSLNPSGRLVVPHRLLPRPWIGVWSARVSISGTRGVRGMYRRATGSRNGPSGVWIGATCSMNVVIGHVVAMRAIRDFSNSVFCLPYHGPRNRSQGRGKEWDIQLHL